MFANRLEAAKEIIRTAEKSGVNLKLIGGLAFYAICPSASQGKYRREYKDIDLIGKSGDAGKVNDVMLSLGYVPREIFNRLNFNERLLYHNRNNDLRVDVFLGKFIMCHKFDFNGHVGKPGLTLPITDLVMTKLQVIAKTDKEYCDLMAAFEDYPVTEDDGGINGKYIAKICANNWGIWRTFLQNLDWLALSADGIKRERVERLKTMIEAEPKSLAWKIRAKIGERKKWYEEPEAVI
jgi:hypothetical protein